jgi:hypothetical protein
MLFKLDHVKSLYARFALVRSDYIMLRLVRSA